MNTLRTKLNLLVLSLFVLAVVGCNPEDGDTGPVGPVGSPGATGPKGDTGPPGQDGQDGLDGNPDVNAFIFTVVDADYSVFVSNTTFFMHRDTLSVPEIDNSVVMDGTIQVFRKASTASAWLAMPYNRGGISYNYSYSNGEVQLELSYSNSTPIAFGNSDFKVVVIPSSSLVKNMDYKNHEMLQAVYGI